MSVTIKSHPMRGRVSVLIPLVKAVVYPVVVDEAFHLEIYISKRGAKSLGHLRESAVAHDLEDVLGDVF